MKTGMRAVHALRHPNRMLMNIVPMRKYLFFSMDRLIRGFSSFGWRFTKSVKVTIPMTIGTTTRWCVNP